MKQTAHANKALRARALKELGIDIDKLAPLLRVGDIVRPAKGARDPDRGGLLPISQRAFYQWVSRGLIEPATTFENGVSAWRRDAIIRIALDGIPREPGHGRKLPAKGRPVEEQQPAQP